MIPSHLEIDYCFRGSVDGKIVGYETLRFSFVVLWLLFVGFFPI